MMFEDDCRRFKEELHRISQALKGADETQRAALSRTLRAYQTFERHMLAWWVARDEEIEALLGDTDRHAPLITDTEWSASEPEEAHAFDLAKDMGTALASEQGLSLFRRGMGYFELLMFEDSRLVFERLVESDPVMNIARLFLIYSCIAQNDAQCAEAHLAHLRSAVTDPLLIAAAKDAQAELYVRAKRIPEAIRELTDVVVARPRASDTWVNLAVCHAHEKQWVEALRCAQHAVSIDEADGPAWRIIGNAYAALGRLNDARNALIHAQPLCKRDPQLDVEIGFLALRLRRTQEAEAHFLKARQFTHTWPDAMIGLSKLDLLRKQPDVACARLKALLTVQRNHVQATLHLGYAHLAKKDWKQALRVFQTVQENAEITVLCATGMARAACERGDYAAALKQLSHALQHASADDRADLMYELGRIHLRRGDTQRGLRNLRVALSMRPSLRAARSLLKAHTRPTEHTVTP